jgi:hypothetical protein
MLTLSLATLLIAVPAVHAQDDMGDLTTKRPAKKAQTVEEESNDPSRPGPLMGLGATYAFENFNFNQNDSNGADVTESNDGSGGYNAHVGYRFDRWLATELEVERYQEFTGHFDGKHVGQVSGWALGGNEKLYLLPGRWQPWLEAGINYLKMETTNSNAANSRKTDDGPALRFGAGLDLYATNKFVVTSDVSYMLGVSQTHNYDVVALTLGFLFRP